MLFELRTYSLYPRMLSEYLQIAKDTRVLRSNAYGMCHGYWYVEFGTLDQVWQLWSYANLDERTERRSALYKNDDWMKMRDRVLPLLRQQEVRFLNPVILISPPAPGGLFELRINRIRPGRASQWLESLYPADVNRRALESHVGLWTSEGSHPNDIIELLGVPSIEKRVPLRVEGTKNDKEGDNGEMISALLEVNTILLRPTEFSPMQ